jgi:hypothetical protein
MIRTYCDICNAELKRNFVQAPLEGQDAHPSTPDVNIKVWVSLGRSSTGENKGDICLECMMQSIMRIAQKHGWKIIAEPSYPSKQSATTAATT